MIDLQMTHWQCHESTNVPSYPSDALEVFQETADDLLRLLFSFLHLLGFGRSRMTALKGLLALATALIQIPIG